MYIEVTKNESGLTRISHAPRFGLRVIEELFAASVFKMLLAEGMISEKLVKKMSTRKHNGFTVHCGRLVKAEDEDPRKTLSEYISKAPFSKGYLLCFFRLEE